MLFSGCARARSVFALSVSPAAIVTSEPTIYLIKSASIPLAAPQTLPNDEQPSASPDALITPSPTPILSAETESSTTGRARESGFLYRPLLVVMDNSPQARPQTGLSEADIVYEAPLDRDGHETRFLAVYADAHPVLTGPVQSARAYLLQIASEWGGILAINGYPTEKEDVYPAQTSFDLTLLENDADGRKAFQRDKTVSSNDALTLFCRVRYAVDQLYDVASAETERFAFSNAGGQKGKRVASVGLPFTSSDAEKVVFTYDAETNRFLRSEKNSKGVLTASRSLVVSESGEKRSEIVSVSNLIVQYAPVSSYEKTGYRSISLVGSGKCDFFVGGRYFSGVWRRGSVDDHTTYLLTDGTPLRLETGSTWIAIHPTDREIKIRYE